MISFCLIIHNEILKQIKNLDTEKVIQQNGIPTKLLKHKSYFFKNFFHKNVSQCIKNSKFASHLKLTDVTPCKKRKSKLSKDHYIPILYYLFLKYIRDVHIIKCNNV